MNNFQYFSNSLISSVHNNFDDFKNMELSYLPPEGDQFVIEKRIGVRSDGWEVNVSAFDTPKVSTVSVIKQLK